MYPSCRLGIHHATCLSHFERLSRLMVEACLMEGKIDLSARRQVTNFLRDAYGKASKTDKARILDEVQAATGVARSTARRLLSGPRLPNPAEQVDRRQLRPCAYGDSARELLAHVWKLMGLPCGKYFVVMLPPWLPLLLEAGDLDHPFATRPGLLLRNSIAIRKAGDELEDVPGMLVCDTVAHCGPPLQGEFARTLKMIDMSSGWTECGSIRGQRVEVDPGGRGRAPRGIPVPREGVRHRQRERIHQPRRAKARVLLAI
jgi:hypothetical protein